MEISKSQKQKIQDWLIKEKRKCPVCQASAENLLPVEIVEAFPPEAATAKGIDTSEIIHNAKIVCQNKNCGFDGLLLTLENIGLY